MAQSRTTAVAAVETPQIRNITTADVWDALRHGFDDFWEHPSHYAFAGVIYPIVMVVAAVWVSGQNILPLLYPLATGFALLGPFVALIFYEISRRQEQHMDTSWRYGFEALRSPNLPQIATVGIILGALFVTWLVTAQVLFTGLFGSETPASLTGLFYEILTTGEGWTLIIFGNLIGFLFATLVLFISVVSFPLLLDRQIDARTAIETSLKASLTNTMPVLLWGLIVALLLALGMATAFVGLVIVMPVLGHATWHIYRKMIVPQAGRVARTRGSRAARSASSAKPA
ncbi:DUF2189 domain-containing protein [Devosia nitrariae]|uniref:DUF2189 domain-containing protein n=1 Tax=Devosia nitrariae TaxID=2071872 RepID=A0ABQ5W957_9HYPH|nr:DUF2189 domain-containing protein [Devosia nitrariae]GLQ56374.1 hypothetical protein GCM10010862_36330 [Devosia nitrariae]